MKDDPGKPKSKVEASPGRTQRGAAASAFLGADVKPVPTSFSMKAPGFGEQNQSGAPKAPPGWGRGPVTLVLGVSGPCQKAGDGASFRSPTSSQPGSARTAVSFCLHATKRSWWFRTGDIQGQLQGAAACFAKLHPVPSHLVLLLHPQTPGYAPKSFVLCAATAWTCTDYSQPRFLLHVSELVCSPSFSVSRLQPVKVISWVSLVQRHILWAPAVKAPKFRRKSHLFNLLKEMF